MASAFCNVLWEQSSVNSWKSDKPVSKICDFENDLGKFVRNLSIHDGLSGFLKHVGSLSYADGMFHKSSP